MPLLYTQCKSCKKNTSFFSWYETRVELAMKKKEEFPIKCKNCKEENTYHVDELKAKINGYLHLFVVLGLLLGSFFIAFFGFKIKEGQVFIFSSIPSVIYLIFIGKARQRVNAFNRTPLKKRLSRVITESSNYSLKR